MYAAAPCDEADDLRDHVYAGHQPRPRPRCAG
jgi:hypothetical protein